MFKKSGKGFNRPFCINPDCPNFLPEDKRGYRKKTEDGGEAAGAKAAAKGTKKTTKKVTKAAPKSAQKSPKATAKKGEEKE